MNEQIKNISKNLVKLLPEATEINIHSKIIFFIVFDS